MNDTDNTLAAINAFARAPFPLRLKCGIQYYDWGDKEYIPTLLGRDNAEDIPCAELWIGAHPDRPSAALIGAAEIPLNDLIGQLPEVILGTDVAARFEGRLPFLLKILSSRLPLSIQAHPDREQAIRGFARENEQGLAPGDKQRNYKDDNHKPELIAALTNFYALRGFRDLEELAASLDTVPELSSLAAGFEASREGLIHLYSRAMTMDQTEVDALLAPLIERLWREHQRNPFARDRREYWVLNADRHFSTGNDPRHRDRGIFSIYFLNLIHMLPGQAMYLPSGELHAYLEGSGVEIMANSNNVLRGGLTPKHVDVSELLATLGFGTGKPEVLVAEPRPGKPSNRVYKTPVDEFELARISLDRSTRDDVDLYHGIHIGIVLSGEIRLDCNGKRDTWSKGEVFLVPAGLAYTLSTDSGSVVYRASVP